MVDFVSEMTVLLVYSPQRISAVQAAKRILDRLGIRSSEISSAAASFADFVSTLEEATHVLLVPDRSSISSDWMMMAAGYSLGTHQPIHLLWKWDVPPEPFVHSIVLRSRTARDLFDFFSNEKAIWDKEQRRKQAKYQLKDMSIDFTELSFCTAVQDGALKAVELFLSAGFSANIICNKGIPVLNQAVRFEHLSVSRLLIEHGADVNVISEDRGNTPLMDAASAGNLEIMDMLIQSGAVLDVCNKSGQTALILAAGQGNTDLAAHLLDAGADFTIADSLGMTVKKYATLFKNEKIVTMLAELEGGDLSE